MPQYRAKLSCARCQFRKLKCTRTEPCSNCASSNQDCEYREQSKRRPISRLYVAGLEDRIAWFENLVNRLKAASPSERDAILDTVDLGDHLVPQAASEVDKEEPLSSALASHFIVENEGLVSYHGPTSIYRFSTGLPLPDQLRPFPNNTVSGNASELHTEQVARDFGIDLRGELITMSLRHFFRWQYPHSMFIYREAFLRDHFSNHGNRSYWSGPLLLAMCALGLTMAPELEDKIMSDRFFSAAETILLVSGMAHPSITTVQAFLCLALYEIGRGQLSGGWKFSGIAFRMAQDLGIQDDPSHYMAADKSTLSSEDIEIRRRIYWGCYISDKIISMMLGRPALLSDSDAGVEITERLPDFPGMEDWLPASNDVDESGQERVQQLVPSFQMQIQLAKIMQRALNELCSFKKHRRRAQIDVLNLELCRWETILDQSLHWNKWQATSTRICPTIAALHMLFHSLRIVLNMEASDGDEVSLTSARIVIAIVRKYRSQCSLKHAPFIFVYGIAKALQVVASSGIPEEQAYLLQALDECSVTWALAGYVAKHALGNYQHQPILSKQRQQGAI
ncbi:hypothetical protein PFICI_05826 [Pestalotiopsis fici W106-1]|uniref:Zn(2)-C6 fungal-type domain-containing protein n=1 Tax=Pestalotiopsis fici (strain W106-1 / CGMCC3.15140) TaxID=1229662 RepID=W3XD14_PESFW|nr:uncharacterized protein PFICI_05826 [Pestalotiopsis fici W106-1]ETS83950.1 hypothetical protein PFICI_05826 [Pestalotiopsis fici W106-1]